MTHHPLVVAMLPKGCGKPKKWLNTWYVRKLVNQFPFVQIAAIAASSMRSPRR